MNESLKTIFEKRIYENMKEFDLSRVPNDFNRYIILDNVSKRHFSHIGLTGFQDQSNFVLPSETPSRRWKKDIKFEM